MFSFNTKETEFLMQKKVKSRKISNDNIKLIENTSDEFQKN